jgi:hypothetical protein
MKIYHRIQIDFDPQVSTLKELTSLLGVEPVDDLSDSEGVCSSRWIYEVESGETEKYFDFINVFLDLLEGKYSELFKLSVRPENISFWMLYEYDGQCNIEFDPLRLKRLAENGISLCVSCWESNRRAE